MKYYLNKQQSYDLDKFAIENIGISGQILMENAAYSTFNKIMQLTETQNVKCILILCGTGNNGGDGFALGRYLSNDFNVTIYFNGNVEKMSNETLNNYNIAKNLDINIINDLDEVLKNKYDVIIESLVGIGADENINDNLQELLNKINKYQAIKIAIDSPAGLNVDNGIANVNCFIADYTFTMFSEKIGLFINDGLKYAGKVIKVNLSLPNRYINQFTKIKSIESIDLLNIYKKRDKNSSKFDFGRIGIIAGSKDMLGAGALTANAAISSGAGLVHLISTDRHSALLPEVICHTFPQNDYGTLSLKNLNEILEIIDKCDVIAIGPGISNNRDILNLSIKIIEHCENKKIIIDADALKCIDANSKLNKNFILTPHIGEFANIICEDRTKIQENRINLTRDWAIKLDCNIILKGYPTIITDGYDIYLNLTGNAGLATAGSGDVLTGILSAVYSRYEDPILASAIATYIHGKIADDFTKNYSQSGLSASKIIDGLKNYEI
jgi:NAD(P)H-hydrate epimerase